MGYYEDKMRAYAMIREMVEKGAEKKEIYLKIATKFGYSTGMVDKYLKLLPNGDES